MSSASLMPCWSRTHSEAWDHSVPLARAHEGHEQGLGLSSFPAYRGGLGRQSALLGCDEMLHRCLHIHDSKS